MKNIHKIAIVYFLSLILFAGCDNLVDIDPVATIDADNYFLSEQDFEDGLIGAYDLLQMTYISVWIGDIATANSFAGGEGPYDNISLHNIDNMTHNATDSELQNIWRYMYAGITRANYIFENKDNIEFEGKDQILAEAAFLRAYYYFELVKFFGDVPLIVDKRLGITEAKSIPRAPVAQVYSQIENDLNYAAEILNWTARVRGRATKGAALSLLGKAYLYQEKFEEAAATLEVVIDDGPYGLFRDGFGDMFLVENEGCVESVFEVQYSGDEGGGYGYMVGLEGNPAVGFNSPRGYTGPIYFVGNSYNCPTQDLADAFEAGDIRKDATVFDIEAFKASQSEEVTYTEGYQHTGYYNHKYIHRANALGLQDQDLTSPNNYRAIRYADVLLMAAEALNRGGINDSKARGYLEDVRERAGLTTDATLTGNDLTEAIYHERRVELACEGHHFFDLVRTGKAAQEIEGFVTGKHELFPIYQDEIDMSGGAWAQNPNY